MLSPEIKKIILEIKPYRRYIPAIAIFGILFGVATAQMGLLIKSIIDSLASGNIQGIQQACLIGLGLSLLAAVSRYIHIYLMNYVGECVGQAYRQKLLSHFLRLNLGFHNGFDTGSGGMLSRVLADASMIQTGLRMVADIFLHPVQLVLVLGNLFILDWKLTLWLFIVVPFLVLFLRSISRSLKKYVPMGQRQVEIMTSTIKEALDGVRIIQSYNLESSIDDRLKAQAHEYLEARKKVHSRIEVASPVTEFLATGLILAMMIYETYEIAAGRSTAGTVMAYITSILLLSAPIKKVQENFVRIQELTLSAQRVYMILEDNRVVPELPEPQAFPKNWRKIEFKNVSFGFNQRRVLDQISFSIERGQKIAFVGESGSGKSTILNLLERFFDPDEGEILVDGISTKNFSLKDLRGNIALVSQDVFLFRDSIENNVWSGNYSKSKAGIEPAIAIANAKDFIQKIPGGISASVGERGGLLSGGEKQRISIARAVFKDASILILDEATSALDSANEAEVQKGLEEAMKGRTSLIVAHRLTTIQNVDRILVLRAGKIVEQGSHEDLLAAQGMYHAYWQMQSGQNSAR
jgi:ATP-binding cassette subfamily B protein/subfamily B ATP-binding cassette protein MsbA